MLINWKLALDIESYATTNFFLESYFSRNPPDSKEWMLPAMKYKPLLQIRLTNHSIWQPCIFSPEQGLVKFPSFMSSTFRDCFFQGPWAQESACAGWGRTGPITTDLWAHTGSSSGWGGWYGQIPCESQRLPETKTHLVGQRSNCCKCKSITEVYIFLTCHCILRLSDIYGHFITRIKIGYLTTSISRNLHLLPSELFHIL